MSSPACSEVRPCASSPLSSRRLALGLGVLLLDQDEAKVGVVVTGGVAPEVSVACMLRDVAGKGEKDWLAIDADGRHATPVEEGIGDGSGVIVQDWTAARRWVEAWVVR